MDRKELERLLRYWGRWFGAPPPPEWDEDDSGTVGVLTDNLLDRMRVGLAAIGSEPIMGERVERHGNQVELLSQRFTAKGRQSEGGAKPWTPPPDAERVELAALDLYRYDRMRGLALRVHYLAGRMRLRERPPILAGYLGVKTMKLRTYRAELELAREWMGKRLTRGIAA